MPNQDYNFEDEYLPKELAKFRGIPPFNPAEMECRSIIFDIRKGALRDAGRGFLRVRQVGETGLYTITIHVDRVIAPDEFLNITYEIGAKSFCKIRKNDDGESNFILKLGVPQ